MADNDNPGQWWLAQEQAEAKAAAELAAAGKPVPKKAEVEPASKDSIDAELDREDAERAAALKRLGAGDEEIQRHVGKVEPKPSKTDIERLLGDLAEMRRTNPKLYWSNEVQAQHLALIEQQQGLKAGKAKSADAPDLDAVVEGLDPELREEWSKSGGIKANLERAQGAARTALDALDEGEAQALQQSFDGLAPEIQIEAMRVMALDAGGTVRAATEASVAAFAGIGDEAQALVKGWGSKAPQRLATAYQRLDTIVGGLGEAEAKTAQDWLGALSPRQRAAVVRAMAGK
jgi:hypothetical protein